MHFAVVHLEGRLHKHASREKWEEIARQIDTWLRNSYTTLSVEQEFTSFNSKLNAALERLTVTEVSGCEEDEVIPVDTAELAIHLYQIQPTTQELALSAGETLNDPSASFSRVTFLPSTELQDLWDSLVFDQGVKNKLLQFMSTLFLFADHNVGFMRAGLNRLILLHGPPGSGKTSLSRALAQKLAIRLSVRFKTCRLIEINSHNLFSKFFSESGKLVGKMFDEIFDMLADPNLFVVVLIDEVETLISIRKATTNEPIDSLRVVNAMLTALDKLRSRTNFVAITTSNLIEAMDPAFLDRVDLRMLVDSPGNHATYTIFRNSLNELIRAGIVLSEEAIPCATEAALCLYSSPEATSSRLWRCAEKCTGFSGRTLAKMPVIMHAGYIQRRQCSVFTALEALEKTVSDEVQSRLCTD